MRLSELASVVSDAGLTGGDVDVTRITHDSREVTPGTLFVALVGEKLDGHDYVARAVEAGASAVVVERPQPGITVPQLVVPRSRIALGKLAARFYDEPSRKLKVIGVTGTNGKTTTTYIVRSIVEASGEKAGVIGTIAYTSGDAEVPATNTTPESVLVERLLAEMVASGMTFAALEVSSHALDQGRVDEVTFAAGVFTNISGEHIDYHKDMTRYVRAKGRLFARLDPDAVAVVNADDPYTGEVLSGSRVRRVIRYGLGAGAEVRAVDVETGVGGSRFRVASPWGELVLTSPLAGEHNVYNCLAAATVTAALGVTPDAVREGIARLAVVPGRLEPVDEGQDFAVFVDYAHTDNALENALKAARKLTSRRVIVVFGCGGDRDRTKRPRMRAVAEELAHVCVVTSDNPRTEDPADIIEQIMRGTRDPSKFIVEVDRRTAIRRAVETARPGDLVLIAGKGHETYQIFKDRTIHFDDREVAREVLREVTSR
ncbi:MAG TPA: UDP-N-acetylmuramoyl-L-alanyl-D-glutamate--2,6-diaminopimelate ligase [Planctomycetota bacterium]|nr:UDP-N-acetylmuramoyl-L-alanyl-D-glutamate--2,6-diaminopimelate ligase [Planctomycetota bacterium]